MKLLLNEQPLQLLPSLVHLVGLNEALFLQQLHFRSLISKNMRDGHLWVCKTYDQWLEEFSFLSRMTIKRTIYNLEKQGYLISTSEYNKMKIDKTKWYRIDYTKLPALSIQDETPVAEAVPEKSELEIDHAMFQSDTTDVSFRNAVSYQSETKDCTNMGRPITKELKELKELKNKDCVEKPLDDTHVVIAYLNEQTGKQFKATSAATKKFIHARVKEGYTREDFIRVIDRKVSQWNHHPEYRAYLRPSTLFNPTNFENYLNEQPAKPIQTTQNYVLHSTELDFSQGEDLGNLASVVEK
ncbi:conserved phage C-terminal domain-containing protein [Sporosarcina sp. P18a]|uniref:conserved phage C-terminal domain-containing protein n=1 Tax=Sporosarcina sp. P18a TaxID=2048259 RepID=UPI0013041E5E|nr:conserved phage C-terminal domain-containing protein [Sporosarcina sp. P18a]